jgi:hypothetical protein
MRILLWHGHLLGGTGSNVYTRSIARLLQDLTSEERERYVQANAAAPRSGGRGRTSRIVYCDPLRNLPASCLTRSTRTN